MDDIKEVVYLCEECKICVDNMYDFREMCLSNNITLQMYISKLRVGNNNQFVDSMILNKLTDEEINKYNIQNSKYINGKH